MSFDNNITAAQEKFGELIQSEYVCTIMERKEVITTDRDGASAEEFTDYLLETIDKIR